MEGLASPHPPQDDIAPEAGVPEGDIDAPQHDSLWQRFVELLAKRGTTVDKLLYATEAELEEILTDLGYRALERAQLRTTWHTMAREAGTLQDAPLSTTTMIPATTREFTDVRILLEHYVDPDQSRMGVSIIELERITNPVLEKRFERRKAELADKTAGVVRRFHSPISSINTKIQDHGFSLLVDGQRQFLRFVTKAPASHPPGAFKLLLCDVAVGKYKAVNNDDGITPEQLVSEGYDSMYLFYPPKGGEDWSAPPHDRKRIPDEFILFHPDQAIPRYVVTFIIHPSLTPASPNSPLSARDTPVQLFSNGKGRQDGDPKLREPMKYWLVGENQLVLGDSLLVGEHKGKTFISVPEALEKQVTMVTGKGQQLLQSIDHLQGLLQALNAAKETQLELKGRMQSLIRTQIQQLHEMLEERMTDSLRYLESTASASLSRITADSSMVASYLDKLEMHSQKVNQMLSMAQSDREEFLLRSATFLEDMEKWDPPYHFLPSVSIAPPVEWSFEVDKVRGAVAGMQLKERDGEYKDLHKDHHHHHHHHHHHNPQKDHKDHKPAPPPAASLRHSTPPPPRYPPSPTRADPPPDSFLTTPSSRQRRAQPPPRERSTTPPRTSARSPHHSAGSKGSARKPGRSHSRPSSRIPTFSVVIVGDAGVGKTRLMEAWRGEDLKGDLEVYEPSSGPEVYNFVAVTSKGKLNVCVCDTPGSQLALEAIGSADAAVAMFDCTSRSTYDSISRWYSYLPYHIPVALCGNKSNEGGRVIRSKDITFHKEVNAAVHETVMNYYDISVASRYNVDKPWTWICRKLMKDNHLVVKEIISTH